MKAKSSGVSLSSDDAAVIKAMLARGDRQHDVAAWFGVNGGRVAEINTCQRFAAVLPSLGPLPPRGPYMTGEQSARAKQSLMEVNKRLRLLIADIEESSLAVAQSAQAECEPATSQDGCKHSVRLNQTTQQLFRVMREIEQQLDNL